MLSKLGLFLSKFRSKITPLPKHPVQRKINGIVFEFDFSYAPAIKSMYFGTYEPEVIKLMQKILKPGNIFIDIGASIGYLSAIALGLVGRAGQVHSFEPVPEYFYKLEKLVGLNKDYNLRANLCALDEKEGPGRISVTNASNIGWNTMVPNFMSDRTRRETIEVTTRRLDNYIQEKGLGDIALIKIDTEGYESCVLKGLSGYFEKTKHRPPIICEITPTACHFLGYTLAQLSEQMNDWGYRAFSAENPDIAIDIVKLSESTNILFMPFANNPLE